MSFLTQSINDMLDHVEQAELSERGALTQLYNAQLSQKHAELLFYKTQISPHFLLNTLECIRGLAQHHGIRNIEQTCCAMADMFRYSLQPKVFVPLTEELNNAMNYFDVICLRFPDRYSLRIHADEAVKCIPILTMAVQPLLENAIRHAFQGRPTGCVISIRAYLLTPDELCVEVTDNGVGMGLTALKRLRQELADPPSPLQMGNHIGLINIRHRLMNTFGIGAGIAIDSVPDHYTKITLIIPVRSASTQEEGGQ
jgi:two-component system sensor histidine kinase YesM